MNENTNGWSCNTTSPAESLEIFESARGRRPAARSDEHDGFFMLLNHADVRGAMSDHKTFSSQPQVLRPMLPRKPIPALKMDPPQHSAWRAVFAKAITAKTPQMLESFVRRDVNRHIDLFIESGRCDMVHTLAEPVPAETICRLMGVDESVVGDVRRTAIAMFAAQGNPGLFGQRQAEFAAVAVSQIKERRARPREDFLTDLVSMEVEGRRLDDDDYVVLLAAFLGAGHHSTTSAIASLIFRVFSAPTLAESLRADPQRITAAIEETLRLHPPFFGFFRRTQRAVWVADVQMPQDADVYMGWAAANRDARKFAVPTEFKLDRGVDQHLSFGFGIHTCPGAAVARMELTVVLQELLRRLPDLRVAIDTSKYQFGGGDYCSFFRCLSRLRRVQPNPGRHE